MPDENALNIYTDGSSFSNPRKGGVGIRFIFPEYIKRSELIKDYSFSGYLNGTNNQMELKACVMAIVEAIKLNELPKIQRIIIHTDSSYVVNNYQTAVFVWQRTRWIKQNGDPVLNADLWKDLIRFVKKIAKPVDFEYVKGHDKSEHNKAVDKLAKESARRAYNKLPNTVNLRRKQSVNKVVLGSVKMNGQKISIRIVTSEYLSLQKIYKYKYEVVSKKSKYFGCVDVAYSTEVLRAAHTFIVKFINSDNRHLITKVFRDLTKEKKLLQVVKNK